MADPLRFNSANSQREHSPSRSNSTGSNTWQPLSQTDINQTPWTGQVITETLRYTFTWCPGQEQCQPGPYHFHQPAPYHVPYPPIYCVPYPYYPPVQFPPVQFLPVHCPLAQYLTSPFLATPQSCPGNFDWPQQYYFPSQANWEPVTQELYQSASARVQTNESPDVDVAPTPVWNTVSHAVEEILEDGADETESRPNIAQKQEDKRSSVEAGKNSIGTPSAIKPRVTLQHRLPHDECISNSAPSLRIEQSFPMQSKLVQVSKFPSTPATEQQPLLDKPISGAGINNGQDCERQACGKKRSRAPSSESSSVSPVARSAKLRAKTGIRHCAAVEQRFSRKDTITSRKK